MKVWINGELVEEQNANISMFDRSYLYGEGLFETLMCYGGRPAFLSEHYHRLNRGCKKIQINLPYSEKEFKEAVSKLIQVNQFKDGVVRLTFSYSGDSFGVGRPKDSKPNLTMFCRNLKIDPKFFEHGVKILPLTSLPNNDLQTAGIKSTSYLVKMIARAKAAEAGAFESILKNSDGYWVEGSKANFFIVLDNTIITAPLQDGILPGITRQVVIDLIKEERFNFREDHITEIMLKEADEIFLTGSTSEVMPVSEVIGMTKKSLKKDSITFKLQKKYRALVSQS